MTPEKSKLADYAADDKAAINSVIKALTDAVRAKDVEGMLAQCAPELVTFDLVPPMRHEGAAAIRRLWAKTLSAFEPPLEYEFRELEVTVGGDVAFAHSLNKFGGRQTDGKRSVNWFRTTLAFRKFEGQWRIVHEHTSVPFDMETGKAMLDLEP